MEHLIARQLNDYLVFNNFLSDKQSGYMKTRRCTTALANVVDDLRLKLDDNYIAFLDLLDYTKSFDTVDHKVLLRKLQTLFHFANSACSLISLLSYEQITTSLYKRRHLEFVKHWKRYSSGILPTCLG